MPDKLGLKSTQSVGSQFDVGIREEQLISVPVNFPSVQEVNIGSNMIHYRP